MRIRNFLIAQGVVLFLVLCHTAVYADTYTFATIPGNGIVSGPPGSTVGWGYSITNQSTTDYLVTDGINAGSFLHGTGLPVFDAPIVAPQQTVTVAFDATSGTGLFQLTWDSSAPIGFINSGDFILSAEWWDGDPFAGGQLVSFADDENASYSATVTPVAAVPEPSTALLLAAGLAIVGGLKKNLKRT